MKVLFQKIFFLFSLSGIAVSSAMAQASSASATLDRNSILIGDQIQLTLQFSNLSPNNQVQWPHLPDSLKGWEVVDTGKIDTLTNAGVISLQQKLIITSFDSGQAQIPAFVFKYAAQNGDEKSVSTQPITLVVKTIDVDTAKPFKPIKDIVEVEQPGFMHKMVNYIKENKSSLIWYAIAALLLITALILFLVWRKKRSQKVILINETPFQKSLRLLHELESQHLYESGKIKEHYSALSDIVRTYLDEQFGMNAMEQTTGELLTAAKRKQEIRKIRPELKRLLQTADLAKFAKANPLPQEHQACFDAAYMILNRTKPTEVTPQSDQ